ncbi:MAG: DUF2905 domain-containing protein [Neisseriaceae bacterium]
MNKYLIIAGIILIVIGICMPLIAKLGIGHLPGDIRIKKDNFTFYFPITTCIIVSLIITLILWFWRR